MEELPQLRQGELPACTNKNMHTHINTAIYTYVCGHCKCFLPRFLSRFSQFSCTGRDVGEKAEADALRATSPEIAENVEEEVVPELLRAVPLSVFATNLECCHALPGPTGQQK